MRHTKLQIILCLSLTLMVGFMSGFATRSLLPQNNPKTQQLPGIAFDSQVPECFPAWPSTKYFNDFAFPASTFAGFNSIFDEMVNETLHPIAMPRSFFQASPFALTSSPDIDLKQTNDHIQLVLSTPGLKPEDVNVSMDGNKLIVKGHHKEQSANGLREETFIRTIDVPYGIGLSRVRKHAANGAVTVAVPRSVLSAAELPI